MSTSPRTRRRRTKSDDQPASTITKVSDKVRALIKTIYTKGIEANAAAKEKETARLSLLGIMKNDGLESAEATVNIDGKLVTLNALITVSGGRKRYTVNVEKLTTLIDHDTLMKVVSVTQASLKEHVAGSVLAQCLEEMPASAGTENVTVSVAK